MHFSRVSLTNFGLGISGSIVRQSFQSSQLHLNWKLLRWYENQLAKLHSIGFDQCSCSMPGTVVGGFITSCLWINQPPRSTQPDQRFVAKQKLTEKAGK